MFAEAHYPTDSLSPEELDRYLAEGWFRMGQCIFTCTYLNLHENFLRVIWLRVVLKNFTNDTTFQKLSKLNSNFKIKVEKASITPEKEELFAKYKTGIAFEASSSLEHLLMSGSETNIYNTLEMNIYDGHKLIAVGYFDVGDRSAEGISCFYDPDYKRHSLGKYMIYQKMLYCKNQGMDYFYLGYFTPGYKAFDYKLSIAKHTIEYLDLSTGCWQEIHRLDLRIGSIEETKQKLDALKHQLDQVNIDSCVLRYRYFDANLMRDLHGKRLFDYFMFVYCFPYIIDVVNPIIVYDFRDKQYHLLHCISLGMSDEFNDTTEEFSTHLLKIVDIIYSTPNVEELADMMSRALQNG
jgi:arginine-tRNA-protein transferase